MVSTDEETNFSEKKAEKAEKIISKIKISKEEQYWRIIQQSFENFCLENIAGPLKAMSLYTVLFLVGFSIYLIFKL